MSGWLLVSVVLGADFYRQRATVATAAGRSVRGNGRGDSSSTRTVRRGRGNSGPLVRFQTVGVRDAGGPLLEGGEKVREIQTTSYMNEEDRIGVGCVRGVERKANT